MDLIGLITYKAFRHKNVDALVSFMFLDLEVKHVHKFPFILRMQNYIKHATKQKHKYSRNTQMFIVELRKSKSHEPPAVPPSTTTRLKTSALEHDVKTILITLHCCSTLKIQTKVKLCLFYKYVK